MKLKLFIALAALVPTLVMAQTAPLPNVGSTGQPGANQQQTATNPNSTTGSSAATGTSTNPTNTPVGGKADRWGSSGNSNVKGSSQGSTDTYPYCRGYTRN